MLHPYPLHPDGQSCLHNRVHWGSSLQGVPSAGSCSTFVGQVSLLVSPVTFPVGLPRHPKAGCWGSSLGVVQRNALPGHIESTCGCYLLPA